MVSWNLLQGVAHGRAACTTLSISGPNSPVERMAHSTGWVRMRSSVPVARHPPGAVG